LKRTAGEKGSDLGKYLTAVLTWEKEPGAKENCQKCKKPNTKHTCPTSGWLSQRKDYCYQLLPLSGGKKGRNAKNFPFGSPSPSLINNEGKLSRKPRRSRTLMGRRERNLFRVPQSSRRKNSRLFRRKVQVRVYAINGGSPGGGG